ncbi:13129_t:CDS:2 [Cetraspora pellucida]|uniref:13129_t:CDS:1 n=1 Tax=Cetraspora pellucida TaxID=1433469 RepID=A0A9N9BLM3_9GLOM|nr:13129_t:CDS:2 [Cetraspora pellucida]
MTKTQAYFGPHIQVYTNETNFKETPVGFLRPVNDLQQTIKLLEKRDVPKMPESPVTLKASKSPKSSKSKSQIEQEFLSIQARALGQLKSALKTALGRFNKKPPKFQNKDDYMIMTHVTSFFEKAIYNLQGYYEYKSSPKALHVFGGVPTVKTGLLTNLDITYKEFGSASSSRSNKQLIMSNDVVASSSRSNKQLIMSNDVVASSQLNDVVTSSSRLNDVTSSSRLNSNDVVAISKKGNIDSPQTNKALIGNALKFPIIIECDDDRDFQSGDRESPIVLDSDDEKDLHLKRKSLPNDCDNGVGPSNKRLRSVKVENDTLGDFIPLEPITLSDLNTLQPVFLRSTQNFNGIYASKSMKKKQKAELNQFIDSNRLIKGITNLRTDLPPIPPIDDPCFATMAVGYHSHNDQWETLEFLGDRVLTSCLLKLAKSRYSTKYCTKEISKSVSVMATNKILAAYTITLGLQKLNGMDFPVIIKLHADAFEAYFGAYYLACGELATCLYLECLMTPLFDLIVAHIASGNNITNTCDIASKYFSMPWIHGVTRLQR